MRHIKSIVIFIRVLIDKSITETV